MIERDKENIQLWLKRVEYKHQEYEDCLIQNYHQGVHKMMKELSKMEKKRRNETRNQTNREREREKNSHDASFI